MFKILVVKPNFFSYLFFILVCSFVFFFRMDVNRVETQEWLAIAITFFALIINIINFQESVLIKNNNYNLAVLLIFFLIGADYLKELNIAIAFLCVSIVNIFVSLDAEDKLSDFYILSAAILFIANIMFYPTWAFTAVILFRSLLSGKEVKSFVKFISTLFMCCLLVLQLLYLTDNLAMIEIFRQEIQFSLPSWSSNFFYMIPTGFFIFLAIMDHFVHSFQQSLIKRTLYNIEILCFILLSAELLIFNQEFDETLVFLYFPIGVFFGRYVAYIKNPYLQNLVMLLTLISLIIIKLFEFKLL